jgi:hypothetical protein
MGQVLQRGTTTTEALHRAIQHSQEGPRTLARRHGINPRTGAKWRRRCSTADLHRPEASLFCCPDGGTGGDHHRFPQAYTAAVRRLPLCFAGYEFICKCWHSRPNPSNAGSKHLVPLGFGGGSEESVPQHDQQRLKALWLPCWTWPRSERLEHPVPFPRWAVCRARVHRGDIGVITQNAPAPNPFGGTVQSHQESAIQHFARFEKHPLGICTKACRTAPV